MGGMHVCLKSLWLLMALCACSAFQPARPHNRHLASYKHPAVRTCRELWNQLNSSPLPELVQVEGLVSCDNESWAGQVRIGGSVVIRGLRGDLGPAVVDFGNLTKGVVLTSGSVVGFQDVVVVQDDWEPGLAILGVFDNEAGRPVGVQLSGAVFWARACEGEVENWAEKSTTGRGQLAAWEQGASSNGTLLHWAAVGSRVTYSGDLEGGGRMELNLCSALVVCDPESTPLKLGVVESFLGSPEAGACPQTLDSSGQNVKLAGVELVVLAVLGFVGAVILALLFVYASAPQLSVTNFAASTRTAACFRHTSGKRAYPTRRNDEIIVSIVEGKRPAMPSHCPVGLASLIEDCWQHEHAKRPTFGRILERLQQVGNEFGHPMSQGLMRIVEESGPPSERQRGGRTVDSRAGENNRALEIVSTGSQDVPTQNLLLGGMLRRAAANNSFWTRRIPFRRSPTSGSEPASSETDGSTRAASRPLSLRVPPRLRADTLWQKPGAPGPSGLGPGRVTPQNLEATSPDAAGRTMVRRGKSAGMWDASKAPISAGAMPWRSVPPNYQRNLRLSGFSNSASTAGLTRPLTVKHGGFGAERRARSANGASRRGGRVARSKSGCGAREARSDLELTSRARAVSEITPASQSTSEGDTATRREEAATSGSPREDPGPAPPSPSSSAGSWSFQSVQSYPSDDEPLGVFVATGRAGDTDFSSSPGPLSLMGESKISWRSDLSTYYFTPNSTAERNAIMEAMGRRGSDGSRRPSWSSGPSGMGGGTGASETESKFSIDFSRSDLEESMFETPTDFVMLDLAAMAARERRGSPTPR
eukprot:evm.model.scf_176EXC.1 EVM.evm.TU.scf_176EXC.1   scf_176EXC:1237-7003(-)